MVWAGEVWVWRLVLPKGREGSSGREWGGEDVEDGLIVCWVT